MPTTAPALSPSRFWSPRYWPTWLGLAIMWCLAHLPYRMQMRLGRLLGRALNAIGGRRRHIAAVNLRLCLPELSEHERAALLRRHLEAVGIAFIETAMSWFASTERLRPLADIRGLEHLHATLAKGRGAIVLMGHFTTMELIDVCSRCTRRCTSLIANTKTASINTPWSACPAPIAPPSSPTPICAPCTARSRPPTCCGTRPTRTTAANSAPSRRSSASRPPPSPPPRASPPTPARR